MTMTMPTTVEILNMAKEYLVERYQEQKNQCIMHWQITNDHAWSSDGQVIVCPDSPPYPDYEEVLKLAGNIYMWFLEEQNHSTQDHSSMTAASMHMVAEVPEKAVPVMADITAEVNADNMANVETGNVVTGNVAAADTSAALGNVYMEQ